MAEDGEFNLLVILCGSYSQNFPIVKKFRPKEVPQHTDAENNTSGSQKSTSTVPLVRHIEVDGCWQIKFNVLTNSNGFADLTEKCKMTDAYIIFYDMTRPQTVAIYDSFIKNIIGTKHKAVRVVGIKPDSNNRSIKRKSQKSRSISSSWGDYHRVIINKRDNETEVRDLYRSIGAELVKDRQLAKKRRPTRMCTIL